MRILRPLIVLILSATCLVTQAHAAIDPWRSNGRVTMTLNGKVVDLTSVDGGEIVRKGGVSTYTPLEVDMPLENFPVIVPEVNDMFTGRIFYRQATIEVADHNGVVTRQYRVVSRQLTVTFPVLDAASRDTAQIHLTLVPVRIEEAPGGEKIALNPRVARISASNFSVQAGGMVSKRIQEVSAVAVVVEDTDIAVENPTGNSPKVHVVDAVTFKAVAAPDGKGDIPEWAARQLQSSGATDPLPLDIAFLPPDMTSPVMTLHFESATPVRSTVGLSASVKKDAVIRHAFGLDAKRPSLILRARKAEDPAPDPEPATPVADTPKVAVTPGTVQPTSAAAVMGQPYYVDGERNLAITLTGLSYSAERYAYGATEGASAEILPGTGQKLLIATFDITNTGDHEIRLPYHYFIATARDTKGGIRRSEGSYRAEDRSEDEVGILPGETVVFETVNIMSAAYPAQELRIANASAENVYALKTAPVALLPASLSADGIAFLDKVNAVPGQWYPAGTMDINLADVRVSRDPVDGENPGDAYEYLLTTWEVRNGARGQRALPGQTFVTAYDANGQSYYSSAPLTQELTTTQPGFAAAGQDGDKQTLVFALYVPKGSKIARIEYVEGGNHTFVFKP